MNKRIKQLAEQVYGSSATEQEIKFAELIVRECADKVHELIKSDGDEFPLQAVSYRIKQHFGVEE